jgi:O-antigen ligase
MGGVVMIWATRPTVIRTPSTMHILVVVMAAVSIFALFFQSGGGLVGLMGRNTTLTGRTEIWKVVLHFAGNPLVGTGYESFWLGNRLQEIRGAFTDFNVNESHNGYLEIYLTLGWIGLILLGIISLAGYRKLLASLPANAGVGSLGLGWFVAGLMHNLTEAGFRMLSLSWIFFLLAIVSASLVASPAYLEALGTDHSSNLSGDDPPSEPTFDPAVFGADWNN